MSAVPHADGVRPRAAPDPHIVELGKLMLTRAPALGEALADRLCREIDAYRDGTVVTKHQVRASCEENLTFVFDSLAGRRDDVSAAEHTGIARALAGVIDAHERGARAALGVGQGLGLCGRTRCGAAGPGRGEDGAQGAVGRGDGRIEGTGLHIQGGYYRGIK